MSTIRVLHVNKLYWPWTGGVEAVVQALAEGSASSQIDVEVLACQARGRGCVESVNGIVVRRVGSLGMCMSTPISPAFPAVLGRMLDDFDVIHLHVPFPLAFFARWGKASRSRLVIHFHGEVSRPALVAIYKALRPWEEHLFERADRIIVTSENLLRHASSLSRYRDKCRVIPLPAKVSSTRVLDDEEKRRVRRRFGLGESDRVILFVGRLVYYKGAEYLVKAMRRVDAKLLVIGEGPLRPALQRLGQGLGLGDRIVFAGKASEDDLHGAYQVADVLAFPSCNRAEAFGLVQLEAMMYGCPVVNTDLPTGVPSVSVHGHTGLTVPPADTDALSAALCALLEDDELRGRFGRNARVRAAGFDRRIVVKQVRDLYAEVCSRAPVG